MLKQDALAGIGEPAYPPVIYDSLLTISTTQADDDHN
jgi:hypothetical protein